MTIETKEQPKVPEKRLFSESRGRYSLLDGNRMYTFDFPGVSSLEENFASISFIRNEIFKAIEIDNKSEKEVKKEKLIEP